VRTVVIMLPFLGLSGRNGGGYYLQGIGSLEKGNIVGITPSDSVVKKFLIERECISKSDVARHNVL